MSNTSPERQSLIYPDMFPCKKLRAVGSIAKDCTFPHCDCEQRCKPVAEPKTDAERAQAWDDPAVALLPILPRYEP